MGKTLVTKLCKLADLQESWNVVQARKVKAGIDGVTVEAFAERAAEYLHAYSQALPAPKPAVAFDIPKTTGGARQVVRLSVQDRVVEGAAMRALRQVLGGHICADSYAYQPGRGPLTAVSRAAEFTKAGTWVVRLDVKDCFSSIPHETLLHSLRPFVAEDALEGLHGMIGRSVQRSGHLETRNTGLLEGSVIAPLLSNWYLTSLDHALKNLGRLVRYADDLLLVVDSPETAAQAVAAAKQALGPLGLSLNDTKTSVSPVQAGFKFLGFTLAPGQIRVAPERIEDFKTELSDRLKQRDEAGARQLVQGWKAYFRLGQVCEDFRLLDAWLEGREDVPGDLRLSPAKKSDHYSLGTGHGPRQGSKKSGSAAPKKAAPAVQATAAPAAVQAPKLKAEAAVQLDDLQGALLTLARVLAGQSHPEAQVTALAALRATGDKSLSAQDVLSSAKIAARARIAEATWDARELTFLQLEQELYGTSGDVLGGLRTERFMQQFVDPLLVRAAGRPEVGA